MSDAKLPKEGGSGGPKAVRSLVQGILIAAVQNAVVYHAMVIWSREFTAGQEQTALGVE